jgi:hypothetical protein
MKKGSISSGTHIKAGGDINATGTIKSGTHIEAGGNIKVGSCKSKTTSKLKDWLDWIISIIIKFFAI